MHSGHAATPGHSHSHIPPPPKSPLAFENFQMPGRRPSRWPDAASSGRRIGRESSGRALVRPDSFHGHRHGALRRRRVHALTHEARRRDTHMTFSCMRPPAASLLAPRRRRMRWPKGTLRIRTCFGLGCPPNLDPACRVAGDDDFSSMSSDVCLFRSPFQPAANLARSYFGFAPLSIENFSVDPIFVGVRGTADSRPPFDFAARAFLQP